VLTRGRFIPSILYSSLLRSRQMSRPSSRVGRLLDILLSPLVGLSGVPPISLSPTLFSFSFFPRDGQTPPDFVSLSPTIFPCLRPGLGVRKHQLLILRLKRIYSLSPLARPLLALAISSLCDVFVSAPPRQPLLESTHALVGPMVPGLSGPLPRR